jgi:Holliday junction resolvase RusA-like endonuclease
MVFPLHLGMVIHLKIKPLSVNEAWQGQRFKTKSYSAFEKLVLLSLRPMPIPQPPFSVSFEFGMSNSLSDYDNPVKPLQDVLQKKYGFNDKDIFEAHIRKVKVKNGDEYFKFSMKTM